jgi:metacaspase-1
MKVLCVHGIGHQEERSAIWKNDWVQSITTAVGEWADPAQAVDLKIQQFAYDDLFDRADSSSRVYFSALSQLLRSWIFRSGERDIFGLFDKTRWTVGMVAQFVALDPLRAELRRKLAAEIAALTAGSLRSAPKWRIPPCAKCLRAASCSHRCSRTGGICITKMM